MKLVFDYLDYSAFEKAKQFLMHKYPRSIFPSLIPFWKKEFDIEVIILEKPSYGNLLKFKSEEHVTAFMLRRS